LVFHRRWGILDAHSGRPPAFALENNRANPPLFSQASINHHSRLAVLAEKRPRILRFSKISPLLPRLKAGTRPGPSGAAVWFQAWRPEPPRFARRPAAFIAYQRNAGLHRAAFWRTQGFPNLVLARAALANKVRLRRLEEWKREELRRTPFSLLDDPPEELKPKKAIRLDTPFKLPIRPRRGY